MKHFLTLRDFSKEEILSLVNHASELKKEPKKLLQDKTLAMIFEKNSTRTRMAFELAITELGGKALFLSSNDLQLSRGEPVKDTARVIGAMVDFVMMRVNKHETLLEFARYSKAPVINALSELYHPTQVLGDLFTIKEWNKMQNGIAKVAFIGDSNNMCNSWLITAAILGFEISIAMPKNYKISPEIWEFAMKQALISGAKISLGYDKFEALKDKDVVITDTWVSMGEENEKERKIKEFEGFMIDEKAMSVANKDAILLHCLPAYRGYEVSEEIFEKHADVIFEEARNRLYVVKALLCFLDNQRGRE
ncbi:ornithine carbamoyltransferase [Campylobacter jejuni]|uniref:Ornithine carbamoyltransferase, anabolic n=3 Tax=Campylobacter jejuni TaxID=197 RepID=OTCA_CAMJE|nr:MULTISPECIES: ornithine carbamoyltransferase [Campylobacter]YP_002344389.1 ornithine carbamoyltransferase [Campylobacter jejuni subsp. jejuni NCTC 11168 = ATCC 700819]Q9PNU6.1 RecName: Full=Ornithine carbamoyltransferase, anabolic; Short=OTCase [Campylobacter jejuni subsp. jejuni NCTC 11168 = ATCC 700819]APA81241.1 Ornithine carbamoyltransferase [Campylobacter jejuni subsp. jejuni D42a]EAI3656696.1 ornithine carbamoyltransferase [Campylobacter fetus]EFV07668.1 ornithine carbamoyltransferase